MEKNKKNNKMNYNISPGILRDAIFDLTRCVALYTPLIVYYPVNDPILIGRPNVHKNFIQYFIHATNFSYSPTLELATLYKKYVQSSPASLNAFDVIIFKNVKTQILTDYPNILSYLTNRFFD